MRSSGASARGFTLFEVLAAVLILGLIYTVLADRAVRGLRSEGVDRRRLAAASLADARLVDLETLIASGALLEPLREESEEGEYRVLVEILPEDVEALLPPPEETAPAPREEPGPRLLVDERGESRLYRMQVVVSWDESGQVQEVRRTTWDFDRSQLALLFPAGEGNDDTEAVAGDGDTEGSDGDGDTGSADSRRSSSRRSRSGPTSSPEACVALGAIDEILKCLSQLE